ncbi:hypothetical protein OG906_21775 [Streptomyces sp. NBC_01426]|uniref:hypothetical protein n=1 Tax=Streptomyces sp. NBC_01426 TaxID=2975866 RepID=UPI002E33072D|nr:hypothetical protein [Streptomyces sp. NBC_01426]
MTSGVPSGVPSFVRGASTPAVRSHPGRATAATTAEVTTAPQATANAARWPYAAADGPATAAARA